MSSTCLTCKLYCILLISFKPHIRKFENDNSLIKQYPIRKYQRIKNEGRGGKIKILTI